MTIDELLSNGWQQHDKQGAAVADSLEQHRALAETDDQAARMVQLFNHTVGEHLADWPRAATFARTLLTDRAIGAEMSIPLGHLAVAQYMAGEYTASLATELQSAAMNGNALAQITRIRMLIVNALSGSKRAADAATLYAATLHLAAHHAVEPVGQRVIAATSNNLASALLEENRSESETTLMQTAANAALEYWLKCGNWQNHERALYLLALVSNATHQPREALRHAEQGLAVIAEHGDEPVDAAFLHLACANAERLLNNVEASAAALNRADALAAEFSPDTKAWYADERAKLHGT